MFADQPSIPVTAPPAMVSVQTVASQQFDDNNRHVIGICVPVPWNQTSISPLVWAGSYLADHHLNSKIDYDTAVVRLIQPPKHGKLMWNDEKKSEFTAEIKDWRHTQYFSDDQYEGSDSILMEVKANGYTILVHYFLSVNSFVNTNPGCKSKKIGVWDISDISLQVASESKLLAFNDLQIDGYALKQVDVHWSFANLSMMVNRTRRMIIPLE